MFYRLLRQDESIENGLWANNLKSETSVFVHAINGTYGESKYISTCGSYAAVVYLQSKSCKPRKIFEINEHTLQPSGVGIIDLRNGENRNVYIDAGATGESINKFHNYAHIFQEVLLVAHIPNGCLIDN